jgi:hypothetical protein
MTLIHWSNSGIDQTRLGSDRATNEAAPIRPAANPVELDLCGDGRRSVTSGNAEMILTRHQLFNIR